MPIVKDLESIFVCSHVFHELCIQQWFEYRLSSTNKSVWRVIAVVFIFSQRQINAASIQQKLDSKFEELNKLKLECSRLEQRNMALAKELTVLKLLSDLDMEQHWIAKLTSLGNEAKAQDAIDDLSWS
ncbi:hypothetical protein SLA2020_203000 [Shorea laevis]